MGVHLHNLVVHFPIALFVTAFGAEILSFVLKNENLHKTACYNFLFGTIGAVAAVLTEWSHRYASQNPVFITHRNFGYATLIFSLIAGTVLLLLKKKSGMLFRILFFISLFIVTILVSITGLYGGKLAH